jgi:hypothetical protein
LPNGRQWLPVVVCGRQKHVSGRQRYVSGRQKSASGRHRSPVVCHVFQCKSIIQIDLHQNDTGARLVFAINAKNSNSLALRSGQGELTLSGLARHIQFLKSEGTACRAPTESEKIAPSIYRRECARSVRKWYSDHKRFFELSWFKIKR